MNRPLTILAGALASIGAAFLFHGPLGTAQRFEAGIEEEARAVLDYYEMTGVRAEFEQGPLRRTIILSGPADEFQRGELVRVMNDIPGVAAARWDPSSPVIRRGQQ